QLEEHIMRYREDVDREREERNYFQLERDQVHTFWGITDRPLEEKMSIGKNLDKDTEDDEQHHQVEIKVYKQKIKHLLCEHQNMIAELKADRLVSIEAVQKEQEQLVAELHQEMKAAMVDKEKLDSENIVTELEMKHDEEKTKRRNNWEEQLREIKAKYEKKTELQKQELDNMSKNENTEAGDGWSNHITTLIEDNYKALSDVVDLTKSMTEEMGSTDMKKLQFEHICLLSRTGGDLTQLLRAKRHDTKLAKEAKEEAAQEEKNTKKYSIEKVTNQHNIRQDLNDLAWDYEAMEQKFSKLQLERDEVYKIFTQNIEKVQHKASVKSAVLERKLGALTDSVETTQAQLSSVLSVSNMDQTAQSGIKHKIQRQEKQAVKKTAKGTQRDYRTQVGGVQEERVKGGRESDGETESGTQKEVSSECADIAELEMLA
ncbi:Growth arrest-specific protein 8, partial [Nibea albiflora]